MALLKLNFSLYIAILIIAMWWSHNLIFKDANFSELWTEGIMTLCFYVAEWDV